MKVSSGVGCHCQVKIWDVYNRRNVKRTYMGHAAGVRWVAFSSDRKTFLSASFDRNIKLWDTERGKCIGNYTKGTIPFQCVWAPSDSNSFLTPSQDSCIHQFDIRTGEVSVVTGFYVVHDDVQLPRSGSERGVLLRERSEVRQHVG